MMREIRFVQSTPNAKMSVTMCDCFSANQTVSLPPSPLPKKIWDYWTVCVCACKQMREREREREWGGGGGIERCVCVCVCLQGKRERGLGGGTERERCTHTHKALNNFMNICLFICVFTVMRNQLKMRPTADMWILTSGH